MIEYDWAFEFEAQRDAFLKLVANMPKRNEAIALIDPRRPLGIILNSRDLQQAAKMFQFGWMASDDQRKVEIKTQAEAMKAADLAKPGRYEITFKDGWRYDWRIVVWNSAETVNGDYEWSFSIERENECSIKVEVYHGMIIGHRDQPPRPRAIFYAYLMYVAGAMLDASTDWKAEFNNERKG